MTREALAHADSRRVRLLALLGVVAALVLVRAEASQAAFSFSGGETAAGAGASESRGTRTSGEAFCSGGSGAGPCFYIAVTVTGGGRVESTADPAGTMVRCPAAGGHACNVPEWFIWALDVTDPFIDFLGIPTTGSWTGWENCPHTLAPPDPNPLGAASRCRIFANELEPVNYKTCLTANFTPGTPIVGGCDEGTPAPVGDPVVVQKAGTGAGTVQSNPAGINCGPTCPSASKVFPISTDMISLFATPESGSTFAGWSGVGHGCSTGACNFTVQGQTIRAVATFNGSQPPVRPPLNTVLFKKPAKTTRKRTATFAWGARREGEPFFSFKSQCRLNRQVWKACAVPKTYRALRPGRIHTVRIRVGYRTQPFRWDTTPVKYSWRVRR